MSCCELWKCENSVVHFDLEIPFLNTYVFIQRFQRFVISVTISVRILSLGINRIVFNGERRLRVIQSWDSLYNLHLACHWWTLAYHSKCLLTELCWQARHLLKDKVSVCKVAQLLFELIPNVEVLPLHKLSEVWRLLSQVFSLLSHNVFGPHLIQELSLSVDDASSFHIMHDLLLIKEPD